MELPKTDINEVKAVDKEVRMENIRNRGAVQDLGVLGVSQECLRSVLGVSQECLRSKCN